MAKNKVESLNISLPISAIFSISQGDVLRFIDTTLEYKYTFNFDDDPKPEDPNYGWLHLAETGNFNVVTSKVLSMENLQHVARLVFPEQLDDTTFDSLCNALADDTYYEMAEAGLSESTKEAIVAYVVPLIEPEVIKVAAKEIKKKSKATSGKDFAKQVELLDNLIAQGWTWNGAVLTAPPPFLLSSTKPSTKTKK